MTESKKCLACQTEVQPTWRFCRYCGAKLHQEKVAESTTDEQILEEKVEKVEEVVEIDRDIYYKVLAARGTRNAIVKEKSELLGEIKALLEQLKAGVSTREYALPKIQELKSKVEALNAKEELFKDLPIDLPLEILEDKIVAMEDKLKKLDLMKKDKNRDQNTVNEMIKEYELSLFDLKNQRSKYQGKIRIWKHEISTKLADSRKELQKLDIRKEMGELTESEHKKVKTELIIQINELAAVEKGLNNML